MQGDPLRKGRLGDERPQKVMKFLSSMAADHWIGEADVLVDIAHLLMLHRQAIIDEEPAKALMAILLDLHEHGLPGEVYDERFEDVHAGIEAFLIRQIGADFGGRLHMGRSRNDEVATCIRVRLRTELLNHMQALLRLRSVLLKMADRYTECIMPGFTHLQHAQPTTLAHHLLAYEQAFGRDFERLMDCYDRVDRCPLGAAAFASTGYPIDRALSASFLGFETLALNTMDAVSARDFAIETIASCTILMSTVSRLCEELVVWSSAFVDFVAMDDAYCSTSSIMPQKKNPDTAEIMRSKTGTVTGALMSVITCMKGLPLSYNRDMQEVTPHLWTAMHETGTSLELLAGMLETASFNETRMAEEAVKGYTTATEVADMMVRDFHIPFRTAHGIVGRAVRKGSLDLETLDESAREMADISLKDLGLTPEMIVHALDPVYGISIRTAPGGPAPKASAQLIHQREDDLEENRLWAQNKAKHIEDAFLLLITEARELIQ